MMVGMLMMPVVAISGHAVPIDRLELIQTGSSSDQVQLALGSPSDIEQVERGDVWLYSGPSWCHVTIHFGADGKVMYVDHDH